MKHVDIVPKPHSTELLDPFIGHLTWGDAPAAGILTESPDVTDLESLKGQVVYATRTINSTEPNPELEPGILVGISGNSHVLLEMPCEDPSTHSHAKTCRVWVDAELVRPAGTIMEGVIGAAILRTEGHTTENHRSVDFACITSLGVTLLKSPKSLTWGWYFPPKPTRQLDGSIHFTNRPLDQGPRTSRIVDSMTKQSTVNTSTFLPEYEDVLHLETLTREARRFRHGQLASIEDFLLSSEVTLCDVTGIHLMVEPFSCISDSSHTELINRFLTGGALASG